MSFIKRVLFVLITGYIAFFFSERVFWSFWRVGADTVGDSIFLTWIGYSLGVYVMLWLIHVFRVRDTWGLFLAAAVFGWIMEGIIAMTTFGNNGMPMYMTISFTALSWHALLTMLIVWYWYRVVLEEGNRVRIITWSSAIGMFWGLWSLAWELETPPIVASAENFAIHAFIITLFFVVSHWIWSYMGPITFAPSFLEKIALVVLFSFVFIVQTVPTVPISLVVLPILLALSFMGLWWNKIRTSSEEKDIVQQLGNPVRSFYYPFIFIIPVVATLIFTIAKSANVSLATNWAVFLITTPLGYWWFIKSLMKVRKGAILQPGK